jgi:N-acetylglucosamine-6-phosphate deacetylase
MIIRGAEVFDEESFTRRDIFIEDGKIVSAGEASEEAKADIVVADGLYAIPGLIDVHTHGCVGREYVSSDSAGIAAMLEYQASRGVVSVCPTTLTLPFDTLSEACERISAASCPRGAEVAGIYLEGPFVSPEKLGAQNPRFVRPPDASFFRKLQDAAGGKVKFLAIAPETAGAIDVIRDVSGEVRCSIAHTTASYDEAMKAFEAGACQVTHMFNAMPPFHHRSPGVIGAAFDSPGCVAELICDNVHVYPAVVRAALKMFGEDRIVMISDSMMATGLGDGDYELGGLPVKVSGRTARLAEGGAIAGSVTDLMGCLTSAVREMRVPLHTAVKCASLNPARALRESGRRGSLLPGCVADVVLLDHELRIIKIMLRGLTIQPK